MTPAWLAGGLYADVAQSAAALILGLMCLFAFNKSVNRITVKIALAWFWSGLALTLAGFARLAGLAARFFPAAGPLHAGLDAVTGTIAVLTAVFFLVNARYFATVLHHMLWDRRRR